MLMKDSYYGGRQEHPSTVFNIGNEREQEIGLPNYLVNTATLNLVIEDRIYAYKCTGPAISLSFTYNANPAMLGYFGRSWSFFYDSAIFSDKNKVIVRKGSGKELVFFRKDLGKQNVQDPVELSPAPGIFDRLLEYQESWVFIEKNSQLIYRYNKIPKVSMYRLSSISDYSNNQVILSYNPDMTISSITDASLRKTQLLYNKSGLCESIVLPDGRRAGFRYDNQQNLRQVIDLQGIVSDYTYDADHYLASMIVGQDKKTTIFQYQPLGISKGISSVTDAAGNLTKYEIDSAAPPTTVRVIDQEGNPTVYFSKDGQTERITDPLGNSIQFGYSNGLRTRIQDKNGNITLIEYDIRGNMVQYTDAEGHFTRFTYDVYDNLISVIDPLNTSITLSYDTRHQLTGVSYPSGRGYMLTYDSKGQLTDLTNPNGDKTRFSYDNFGNLHEMIDPLLNKIRIDYDSFGLTMTSITDARGNRTLFKYDNNGRLVEMQYPDGKTKRHGYGCCAPVSVTDQNGNTTRVSRNPLLSIIERVDPTGSISRYVYDRSGNLTRFIDPLGKITLFTYNANGRVVQLNRSGSLLATEYDKEGNIIACSDEKNRKTHFEFNRINVLTKITDPLDNSLHFRCNEAGDIEMIKNSRENQINYLSDREGRITEKQYDGVRIAGYEYDGIGNITRVTDDTGSTSLVHDGNSRVTGIRYPDGKLVSFSYDASGNLSSIRYPWGLEVNYTYDECDRLKHIRWGNQSIEYRYNPVGNLVSEMRSNGTKSYYYYDARSRLTRLKHQNGEKIFFDLNYVRDASGNIAQESGLTSDPDNPSQDRRYPGPHSATFNTVNQVTSYDGDSYTYDRDGNLVAVQGKRQYSAVFDPENRPVKITRGTSSTEYQYDGLGNRTKVVSDGSVKKCYHSPDGKILFESNEKDEICRYFVYLGDRLGSMGIPDKKVWFYHFDASGNTRAITDESGTISAAYAYDPFGNKVSSETDDLKNPYTFVGAYGVTDENDGLYFMRYRYYDACTARFIQKDPIGYSNELNLYRYVGNNPLNYIDPSGTSALALALVLSIIGLTVAGYTIVTKTKNYAENYLVVKSLDAVLKGIPAEERQKIPGPHPSQDFFKGMNDVMVTTGRTALGMHPVFGPGVKIVTGVDEISKGNYVKGAWNLVTPARVIYGGLSSSPIVGCIGVEDPPASRYIPYVYKYTEP